MPSTKRCGAMSSTASSFRPIWAMVLLVVLLPACAHSPETDPEAGEAEPEVAAEQTERDTDPRPAVTAEDIERNPSEPIEQQLQGRIAGVRVTRLPNGDIAVRIRGTTSIRGSNEPLYIVDGVPFRPGPGGGLSGIQVSEIESIEVLKDATATAMYGVRGANGVVIIKLKKPES